MMGSSIGATTRGPGTFLQVLLVGCLLSFWVADAAAVPRRAVDGSAILLVQAEQDSARAPRALEPGIELEVEEEPPADQQREQALEVLRENQRSSKAALFMTFVVPGWGQLYADSPFWSVVAFSVQMYYIGNIVMEARRAERQSVRRDAEPDGSTRNTDRGLLVEEHRERIRDFVWWSAGGFLIIALDAYVSVELADFDSPDPPTPDLERDWELEPDGGGDAGAGLAVRLDFAF